MFLCQCTRLQHPLRVSTCPRDVGDGLNKAARDAGRVVEDRAKDVKDAAEKAKKNLS